MLLEYMRTYAFSYFRQLSNVRLCNAGSPSVSTSCRMATSTFLPMPRQPVPAPACFSWGQKEESVFAIKVASVNGVKSSGSSRH